MNKRTFKITFTKPQNNSRWTGIGLYHTWEGESYFAISIMSYELAIGLMGRGR